MIILDIGRGGNFSEGGTITEETVKDIVEEFDSHKRRLWLFCVAPPHM